MTKLKPWQQYQAVYVHIPFCVQKCLYCDFASYACCDEVVKNHYVEALCKEIAQPLQLAVNPEATIYFGGGTPSTLSLEQLKTIVKALKQQGLWQKPREASIEVNPGTVDLEKLQGLRALGFDRISLGVQALNNEELRTIGRIHSAEQALEAIALAKQAGFERINADLIYGLPGQSLESLQQTLQTLTHTVIDHISVYGLIVEEGTPLAALVAAGKLALPEEDEAADMYDYVQKYLEEQGFVRYEVSNYARSSKSSKAEFGEAELASKSCLKRISYSHHNDVYWRYLPYAAFGASGASFDGQARYTRPCSLKEYENWVEKLGETDSANGAYAEIKEHLSPEELLGEYMMMGLRRVEGADLKEAQERFKVDVMKRYQKELEPYLTRQLLRYEEGTQRLMLTPAGMAIGNQIFAIFV